MDIKKSLHISPVLWRHEWMQLCRRPSILVLFILFLIIGLYGIDNGKNIVSKQLLIVDSLHLIQDANMRLVVQRFHGDTSTANGKMFAKQAGMPKIVEFRNPPYAINSPSALSVLAIGQRNLLPFFDLVNTKRTNLTPPDLEIANPEKLAAGNFDLVFVFMYLLPLMVLVWCYNIRSEENEQQTHRLLQVHGIDIRRVVVSKLRFRYLIVSALTLVISLIGFIQAHSLMPINTADVAIWLLGIQLYLCFWFLVCLLLSYFNLSSQKNAILLLGLWLLLAILIPAILVKTADATSPLSDRASLDSRARNITYETWEMPIPAIIDSFYRYNPHYRLLRKPSDTAQYGNKRFAAYQYLLGRRLKQLADPYYRQNESHNQILEKLYWFDPVVSVEYMLTANAENTKADYTRFEKQVNHFQQDYTAFMNQYLLKDQQLTLNDLPRLPRFILQHDPAKPHRLLYSLLPVSLLAIALLLCTSLIKIKN